MEYAFLLMTKKQSLLEVHRVLAPRFMRSFKQFCLPVQVLLP